MKVAVNLALSAVVAVLCLIPLWVYLLASHCLHPEGFWQHALVMGAGIYLLGGLQFMLFFVLIGIIVAIWDD